MTFIFFFFLLFPQYDHLPNLNTFLIFLVCFLLHSVLFPEVYWQFILEFCFLILQHAEVFVHILNFLNTLKKKKIAL